MALRTGETQSNRHCSLLFVCGGNSCRSPMAVAIAKKKLGRHFRIESAGVDGALGCGATRFAKAAMKELGLDISKHKSRDISSIDMSFDYVIAMTPYVAERLKATSILENESLIVWNILDPYGKGLENYRICAKAISKLLDELAAFISQQNR